MAREDPINQVEQARASERCVVRLAAARGHVHPVSGRSKPLDCGTCIRVSRVDAGHRLPFEFPRHGEASAGGPATPTRSKISKRCRASSSSTISAYPLDSQSTELTRWRYVTQASSCARLHASGAPPKRAERSSARRSRYPRNIFSWSSRTPYRSRRTCIDEVAQLRHEHKGYGSGETTK